eukprot:7027099-Prorocentrum_lima.AAC.1
MHKKTCRATQATQQRPSEVAAATTSGRGEGSAHRFSDWTASSQLWHPRRGKDCRIGRLTCSSRRRSLD